MILVGCLALTLFCGRASALFVFKGDVKTQCPASNFLCNNKHCIPYSKVCNSKDDCGDNSDEEGCSNDSCHPPEWFYCKRDKKCISHFFLCDGENDCGDFSDEENCGDLVGAISSQELLTKNISCEQDQWKCDDNLCIHEDWVCNDAVDCLDGSDEARGCTERDCKDGFKCVSNGVCLPKYVICDNKNDCEDKSDEMNCRILPIIPEQCKLDKRKYLCKDNVSCINLDHVCDSRPDCPDKSDEGAVCKLTLCPAKQCSHDCVMLPSGPKCLCPVGYHAVNSKDCADINECEIYGICDQKCRNTAGSYECYCDDNYVLDSDKKTCRTKNAEALMVFSIGNEIRGYFLNSRVYFPMIKNLSLVAGVDFDGTYLYWTDITLESETITRSLEDGSEMQRIVTSGLSNPEDLCVDWITKNVYFTDLDMRHIGVCTSDGTHCTVLVNTKIEKPRAIVLDSIAGEMYWTDWGEKAKISRAKMDGSDVFPLVQDDIYWPNGLALDYHNERLYWTDAKHTTVESIRLDGTDRRVILNDVIKHPYAIGVFENRLYWSDLATHSLESCEKFTCKNRTTLVKESHRIFGIHIHHSSIRKQVRNPCANAFCSDICLLKGTSYSCACPQEKILSSNGHLCLDKRKKEYLIAGTKHTLVKVHHKLLGTQDLTWIPKIVNEIGALAYNGHKDSLIIFDSDSKSFISVNLNSFDKETLFMDMTIGKVSSIQFDDIGQNIYWADVTKKSVNVYSTYSHEKTVILHDMGEESPIAMLLIPTDGLMFIAFEKPSQTVHIDRMHMDGSGRTHVIEQGLIGPLSLTYNHQLARIYWLDQSTGNIESTSLKGDDRHGFVSSSAPLISLTSLENDIFWSVQGSDKISWVNRLYNESSDLIRRIELGFPKGDDIIHLVAVTPQIKVNHPCQSNNGNCSHICLVSGKDYTCSCPIGMKLGPDYKTCLKPLSCENHEFLCSKSQHCIPQSMRCNGHKDCNEGEDEENCKSLIQCPPGHFQCDDGECIQEKFTCDYHYDCKDRSDEQNCTYSGKDSCGKGYFKCSVSGQCISERFLCDQVNDCSDGSDEFNCQFTYCGPGKFRCSSGTCIPKGWECDGEIDCPDLSDEHQECEPVKCDPNKFTCTNGFCIEKSLQCNGFNDCGDSSDEIECETEFGANGCRPNEFSCPSNNTICLPLTAKCNGTSECLHHEDEKNCSKCHVEEFECKNKKCISSSWVCDHANDCGDDSDESPDICLHHDTLSAPLVHVACQHGYRCKSGHCIDMSLVCNGQENCYDGSDEHGSCSESCETNNPCSQICHSTPSGPACSCFKGYQLTGDGHSCIDVKECSLDPPVCSQTCGELEGNFSCDCFPGFVLRTDKISCKGIGSPMELVVSTSNEIFLYSQHKKSISVLYKQETPRITGLDVSVQLNYVYFSIQELRTISRIHIPTGKREYLSDIGYPQTVSVDWISQNIYFNDADTGSKSIKVCNFDHQKCVKLLNVSHDTEISVLTVDPINKYLFYAVVHWWVFNVPSTIIYRCNLDGTNVHELVTSVKGFITGMACDFNKKNLYYANQHEGNILRVTYDGKGHMAIPANITKGMSLFEDHLYFLMQNGYMGQCKLFGEKVVCDSFRLNAYQTLNFAMLQSSRQPEGINMCKNHNCSHLCIPSDVKPRCLCGNSKIVDEGDSCLSNQDNDMVHNGKPKLQVDYDNVQIVPVKSRSGSLVAGILAPLLLIIICIVAYCILKRKSSGKFNVSVRFQNPVYGVLNHPVSERILRPDQHEYTNPIYNFKDEDKIAINKMDS